jgi:UDP-N-acetylmuramate--alanine ligase
LLGYHGKTLLEGIMQKVHFVGVSGIGMSAAAEITMASGVRVSGSALEENELTRRLGNLGLTFFRGHRARYAKGRDVVVVSAAVPENNPEVSEARQRGIPVYLYSEYLGRLMEGKRGVAVAGTHGKTTTTAMLATIARFAGLSPTAVCGGVMREVGSNALIGTGDLFIAEACEYNRSFLHLPKKYAIVTNIEPEHLDYYSGLEEIREAFKSFMESTDEHGFVCVNGDDGTSRELAESLGNGAQVLMVGHGKDNQYRVEARKREGKGYRLHIRGEGFSSFSADLPVPGRFNVMNASIAAVCASNIGISSETIRDALEQFKGTERRLELLSSAGDRLIYSDYAHHPTEIKATLQALEEAHPGRTITLIFQPHQYSRTSHFFHDFIRVLQKADRLVLTEVYRQRDREGAELTMNSSLLYRELQSHMGERVTFMSDRERIPAFLEGEAEADEVVLFMGAGDIDEVAREYASAR